MAVGSGRPGVARGTAVLTYQQVAEILFRRGVLASPHEYVVRWCEREAFRKIRAADPGLVSELAAIRDGHERTPVVEIY